MSIFPWSMSRRRSGHGQLRLNRNDTLSRPGIIDHIEFLDIIPGFTALAGLFRFYCRDRFCNCDRLILFGLLRRRDMLHGKIDIRLQLVEHICQRLYAGLDKRYQHAKLAGTSVCKFEKSLQLINAVLQFLYITHIFSDFYCDKGHSPRSTTYML